MKILPPLVLKVLLTIHLINMIKKANTFEVKEALIDKKGFSVHFWEDKSLFIFSKARSSKVMKFENEKKVLVWSDSENKSIKIPIKVNTHKLEVRTQKPINFYLLGGGLTMPKKEESQGEEADDEKSENFTLDFPKVREFISGDFSELRCIKENRGSLMIENQNQYIEIDIGKMMEASEKKQESKEIRVKIEMILDFYDDWEDDSLFLIERNSSYLLQSNHKNCKGSLTKKICKEQLRDICRNNKPDSLGHIKVFNLAYSPEKGLILKLSISRDLTTENQKKNLDFGLGLYAIFVYRV